MTLSSRVATAALLIAGAAGLTACAGTAGVEVAPAAQPGATSVSSSAASDQAAQDGPAPEAPVGEPAGSTRVRFVPTHVVLPGGAATSVQPASTVDGVLEVPENVKHVGWWDGSAYAGDPFGNTVIAGHVDSATDGLGFFSRIPGLKKGQTVTLQGSGHHLAYKITSVQTIKKGALATGSETFDQTGDPRLVLITCGGAYHRGQGGYDSNVVVTATPLGLAR